MFELKTRRHILADSLKEIGRAEKLIVFPANSQTCRDSIDLNTIDVPPYWVAASVIESHASCKVQVLDDSPETSDYEANELLAEVDGNRDVPYSILLLRSTRNCLVSPATEALERELNSLVQMPVLEADLIVSPYYFEKIESQEGERSNRVVYRKGKRSVPHPAKVTVLGLLKGSGLLSEGEFSGNQSYRRGVEALHSSGVPEELAHYHMYEACLYTGDVNGLSNGSQRGCI